ncbi:uncharacterized protein [Solanum lycopersicum]|uniref:uncharacterized protein n=1 Tax=Solanum lycopersicum TaxID=4081 RepID=UPI000E1CBC6E|nr:putative uncharacterized protein DDB_G0282499 [Solanum lycopersicum]
MGTNFQSIDVHLADSSNNIEGRNNFNNNSLSHYDSTLKLQQGRQDNEEHESVSSRNAEQHNVWEVQAIRTPTMGEGSKTQPGGNLIEKTEYYHQQHEVAYSNSSYLTPHIIVDASQVRPNENDKGEEKGQTQPQRQEQASHFAGMEMHQRTNDQRNAANGKESQQIHKPRSTQAQRQENNQQGETNSANQSNRTTMNFQSNFPKIFNNFTRYDPNSQIDRNKQMNNAAQGNARPPNIQQQGQNISNNVKEGKISEPSLYTVVQSFAARLRYNQSKNEIPIVLNDPIHTTRQGYPAVLLDENDNYVKLAECCLSWHCYNKVLLTTILESIGKVLYLDSPTSQKTRGSTTRVKFQVDLTKKRPEHVWLGFKNSDPNKGRWLKVQYEDKSRGDQHEGGDVIEENVKQNKKGNHQEGKKQETRNQGERNYVQEVSEKEEQWQIQRRKQSKNLEQVQPKTTWRAHSPQHKKVIDDSQQAAGIPPSITTHNVYSDLEVQEQAVQELQLDTSGKKGAADSNIQLIQEPVTASSPTTQTTNVQNLHMDNSERKGDADSDTQQNEETNIVSP